MDELRDPYFRRMLKTWSAAKRAPAGTRAQLLHRAAELVHLEAPEWSHEFAMQDFRSYKRNLVFISWRPLHSMESSLSISIMML